MDLPRITRQSHRKTRPGLRLLDRFNLQGARAHEACGPARRRLALWLAQTTPREVLWIRPDWHPDRLHMAGVRAEIDPARLIFVECCRPADLLWCMEEALRTGLSDLVVCDLPEPPGLTPVRRLHLAAEAGAEQTGRAPLGLLLTPGEGGSAGIETRWSLTPTHRTDAESWTLARLRARDAAPGEWMVERGTQGKVAITAEPRPEPSQAQARTLHLA
ncbi:ImuA family protein [Gymnodinialimonas hymeniacidonis]|uniref:ImuA family protein n=1 Tax=Gymnodinialimonas hymeniacidonis TaxID=3126508 RepID=UPI0034C670C6